MGISEKKDFGLGEAVTDVAGAPAPAQGLRPSPEPIVIVYHSDLNQGPDYCEIMDNIGCIRS